MRSGQGSAHPGQGSEGQAVDHDKRARDQRAKDQDRLWTTTGGPEIRRASCGPRQVGQGSAGQ